MSLAQSNTGLSSQSRDVVLLIAVGVLIFFANLGGPPLWDRDEPRNAGCAAEMMAANDWICLLYTSPSPRDQRGSRMPSSA